MSWQVRPMSLVVGGIVKPDDVVGRYRDAAAVLAALPHSGAVLVGDRRHGKTSLARMVAHQVRATGALVGAASAERGTYADFVSALAAELARFEPSWSQELAKLRVSLNAGPVTIEREARAATALDELLRQAVDRADGRQVVLFIDEVTVLARRLERAHSGAGDDFLRTLRRFRQEYGGGVATVLSGSIGFHHVSVDAPSTVNDIRKITVGPIRADHAAFLAECLLLGIGVYPPEAHRVAPAVAEAAEGVPYYIQHLVLALQDHYLRDGRLPPADQIPDLVTTAVENLNDPWDLRHYRDRLPNYYGSVADVIAGVLDIYAHAGAPLTVDDTLMLLRGEGSPVRDRHQLVSLIERLELDHYLVRVGDSDRFASPLIQRAWRAMRR
ncbi:AAA family ATPase [Mycobacterium sp. MS1601]|uniref:AAA family ATPase n=1 Tax=Mycobacterium sp. MS1601 TaxID=1936029 RepID=UPI003002F36C